jgi:phospholipid/cholesterol/gamma-HCH transport system substrate-binding protein
MNRKLIDFWVGVFVLLGTLAMVFLALKVGNFASAGSAGKTYRLIANFENIGQLKPRAAVKTSGVVVGRVAGIHYDSKEHRAVVELDIEKEFQFDKDSTAQVLTAGVLGEQYLGIEPGGNSQMLKDHEVIMQTQGAFVLEKLISDFIFNKSGGNTDHAEKSADPLQ